jgi:hypothetical protein
MSNSIATPKYLSIFNEIVFLLVALIGDVDSGGEDEIYGTFGPFSLPIHSMQQILAYNEQEEEEGTHQQQSSCSAPQPSKHPLSRRNKLHETKL